jgi:hypothetical protein
MYGKFTVMYLYNVLTTAYDCVYPHLPPPGNSYVESGGWIQQFRKWWWENDRRHFGYVDQRSRQLMHSYVHCVMNK